MSGLPCLRIWARSELSWRARTFQSGSPTSFVFGAPGFPLSDVPLQTIAEEVAAGRLKAKPSRVFGFEDVLEGHRVMEAGEAKGKLVVVHE
ncbi:zinc-binding dehydrogenase [Saccharopolyspora spinosa]|uniref:zinc-binding dehydrogenase n=1 Tax=Saccharopolyspora spinosa TaxID=60894 RepID=UPI00192AF2E6|nr:zinc-binding dehydrogenase [Saccharopolyspora spinosa]